MQVIYCDLCGAPLKENGAYTLYVNNPDNPPPDNNKFDNANDYYYAYNRYIIQLRRDVKEICPSCKFVFDKMFELRLQRLSELADTIYQEYQLPSRKNPKERDNGKEKKK
jgi:hypothetical protein